MNINKLKEEVENIKYNKYRLLFFSGKKEKFKSLVNQLPDCKILSVRQLLIDACREQDIKNLDAEHIAKLVKEILPRPLEPKSVALIDNELFLKYGLFFTTMKSQTFQNRLYIIHIPSRYCEFVKKENLIELR